MLQGFTNVKTESPRLAGQQIGISLEENFGKETLELF